MSNTTNNNTDNNDDELTRSKHSYIDYTSLLASSFSATQYANALVHQTNNANDTPLDLTTPLQRSLFDIQEIDTRIDALATSEALPLLTYTQANVEAGARVLAGVEERVAVLAAGYERLKREVGERHARADECRALTHRVWRAVRLGREVSRAVTLARQLEAQMGEMAGRGRDSQSTEVDGAASATGVTSAAAALPDEYGAMVRASHTILAFKDLLARSSGGLRQSVLGRPAEAQTGASNDNREAGEVDEFEKDERDDDLNKVQVVRTLRQDLFEPAERRVISRAEQIISQFSMSSLTSASQHDDTRNSTTTDARRAMSPPPVSTPLPKQTQDDTRSRATSALIALYLLSPLPQKLGKEAVDFTPSTLTSALSEYLRRSITSSLASLTAALSALPRLDRALAEISARCQNIVALEMLLSSIPEPEHPLLPGGGRGGSGAADGATGRDDDNADSTSEPDIDKDISDATIGIVSASINDTSASAPHTLTLLDPLLAHLDTPSLPSYFWRSTASQLSSRVHKILRDGGVSARTLRSNRDTVRDRIRRCVERGCELPAGVGITTPTGAASTTTKSVGSWEREAAVMTRAVVGPLEGGTK